MIITTLSIASCSHIDTSSASLLVEKSTTQKRSLNHEEKDGLLVIEAEHFSTQHKDEKRRWVVFSKDSPVHSYPDSDENHYQNASNGKYIEILPDTRTNHFETLIRGENFSAKGGNVAILSYPVYINSPGKYYVWARAYSTGSEDNGIHFGINGEWPESAQRLQLCKGKHQWTWSSAQRIKTNHCGTPNTVYFEIERPGLHTIMLSMREDGFELDKIILTKDAKFVPVGISKPETISQQPTLIKKDKLLQISQYSRIFYALYDFSSKTNTVPFYPLESEQALAINLSTSEYSKYSSKYAYTQVSLDRRDAGKRKLTLVVLGQTDRESTFKVLLNGKQIGEFSSHIADYDMQEQYFEINNLNLKANDVITVGALAKNHLNTNNNTPNLGGIWRAIVLSREE